MPVLRTAARSLLVFAGGFFALCAFLSGAAALSALAERLQHGSGLMFADVEFFALAAAVLGAAGGMLLWLGLRPGHNNQDSDTGASRWNRKS